MTRRNPFAQYEEWGEEKVRHLLATGRIQVGSPNHNKMSSWLKLQEDKRSSMEAVRVAEREDKTLSIDRKALEASTEANSLALEANFIASETWRVARRANIIAISAIILSVITTIVPKSIFISFLQWLGILNP